MKKVFLLSIAAGLAVSSFAQNSKVVGKIAADHKVLPSVTPASGFANKTSTVVIHDTLVLENITSADTITNYYLSRTGSATDSGFLGGMNFLNTTGFAERYDFSTTDSSVQVLGVLGVFGGTVNPASTNSLTMKAWSSAGIVGLSTPTAFYSGLPGTVIDSVNVPFTSLGVTDTTYGIHAWYFATPTAYLTDSFFVGYSMNYTWGATNGDTLAVVTTRDGGRASAPYLFVGGDTIVNNQVAVELNGQWVDMYNDINFDVDFYLFAIVNTKSGHAAGVNGITKKDFTFFSTYPNPASNNVNVKYGISDNTDVTIQIMDMSGRTISTTQLGKMAAGEHVSTIETANIAAGDYLCVIHTSNGGGIAAKFTVAK